ncbi:hypothetical protein [Endozoicomonas ascidiicola]|nr:hypothetical protein [Endozoicomonas ascidiicola]
MEILSKDPAGIIDLLEAQLAKGQLMGVPVLVKHDDDALCRLSK